MEERKSFDYVRYKDEQYDKLADHLRRYADVPLIYQLMKDDD